jgi:hypothetical protein
MTTYTILVKFNDGSSKCIKSFYSENDAITQLEKIVEEEVKKFDKHIDAYVYLGDTNKSIVYDEYFSCDREIEFFPIAFEIIEQEIDDSIFDWREPDEQPIKGSYFVVKMKNGKYIYGEIILESGWIASPYFATAERTSPYWGAIKNKIEKWFYVKK